MIPIERFWGALISSCDHHGYLQETRFRVQGFVIVIKIWTSHVRGVARGLSGQTLDFDVKVDLKSSLS